MLPVFWLDLGEEKKKITIYGCFIYTGIQSSAYKFTDYVNAYFPFLDFWYFLVFMCRFSGTYFPLNPGKSKKKFVY